MVIDFHAIKANFSHVASKSTREVFTRLGEAIKSSSTGIVMEGESVFVPWVYLLFLTKEERNEFLRENKEWASDMGLRLTKVYGEPCHVPEEELSGEFLENIKRGKA